MGLDKTNGLLGTNLTGDGEVFLYPGTKKHVMKHHQGILEAFSVQGTENLVQTVFFMSEGRNVHPGEWTSCFALGPSDTALFFQVTIVVLAHRPRQRRKS